MSKCCELCSSDNRINLQKIDAKNNAQLNIYYCSDCSFVQQKNIPSDEQLNIYYSHNYRQDYKSIYSPKPKYVHRAGLAAIDRIKFLESHIQLSNQTLLDIGAGGGEFVYIANKRGLQARGIEPNVGYSEFSKEEYGVEVKTAMLSEVEDASADILTLFHVFEHMAKPHEVMKKLYASIKDNGYLFIEVPNILQADASPHNIYFKAHLFYYSRFTLNSLASRYFELVKVDDRGNLKMLFRKKTIPSENFELPTAENIDLAKNRMRQKGWLEYLFIGGGILKPFSRIEKMIIESQVKKMSPKMILDNLYEQRHEYSKPWSKRNIKRIGGWSSAGGLGLLCFEVFC